MSDIQITDQLDKPVPDVKVDPSSPSSLVKYLKTKVLHLAVLPDFIERKDLLLSKAAPKPIRFDCKIQHEFQLGNTHPEIGVTPGLGASVRANASSGSNLFESDPYHLPATVPPGIGYVSAAFTGSLGLGVSGTAGDLTFGLARSTAVSLEFLKAFPLGTEEPTLGDGLGQAMSCFVIPADLSDLSLLRVNDIATVSGQGSLKVSGGISASAFPNPLASVNLPLGAGTLAVKAGPTVCFTTSFEISGSYQVRVLRKDADIIQLSISPEKGTMLKADFTASAGVTAAVGQTDLIAALLNMISVDPEKEIKALGDLEPAEAATLHAAIADGLNHGLQASIDLALSSMADNQAAFQYEIQPAKLTPDGSVAVHKALDGDLRLLTAMEDGIQSGGILAPGLKMLNSIFYETRKRGTALKLNLVGILNYTSVLELIRNSEILKDAVTGDVTIKEKVTGNTISAIVSPLDRAEALRKVMFDSVVATTCYVAAKAAALPQLECEQVHFAFNQNTSQQTMRDYLNWLQALNLITADEETGFLTGFTSGGASTCVLRTSFNDDDCVAMFFDRTGSLRPKQQYLDIGKSALHALLDTYDNPNDRLRSALLEDGVWQQALSVGANSNLGPLVGLSTADPRVEYLIGDVSVITSWAEAMVEAGALVLDMRRFVGNTDPAVLMQNNEFKNKRAALQSKLAAMVKASKVRFEEPWGMVCLFAAAGSPRSAYGKAVTRTLIVDRGAQRTRTAEAAFSAGLAQTTTGA